MYGLVIVKYCNEPILLLYKEGWSNSSSSLFGNFVHENMGVGLEFASVILVFDKYHVSTFLWVMLILYHLCELQIPKEYTISLNDMSRSEIAYDQYFVYIYKKVNAFCILLVYEEWTVDTEWVSESPCDYCRAKLIIPCPWCLFKPIQGFMKFSHIVKFGLINKAHWLVCKQLLQACHWGRYCSHPLVWYPS